MSRFNVLNAFSKNGFDTAILANSTLDRQIAALFANNEQGVWYDIDPAYCYQDAAGTTPAVVGQPVGLVLDRSGRGNHASQTTATSRPILRQNAVTGAHYLEFDGSDDFLVTNSIDFTATDEVTVMAGIRKLSDAVSAIVVELSSGSITNDGSFHIAAPAGNGIANFELATRGTVRLLIQSPTTYPAPISAVVHGAAKIAADEAALMVNGVVVAQSARDQGTGNYGNHPLYIGRRGGTVLTFSGHLYGLLVRGAQSTEAQIKLVERYLAKKTGVTLA